MKRVKNQLPVKEVGSRVGAQAEAEWVLAACGGRTTIVRAKALLLRIGTAGEVREGDEFEAGL